jgi:hypothetical protein
VTDVNDQLIERLNALLTTGAEVLATYRKGHSPAPGSYNFPSIDRGKMKEFEARARSCLVGALGDGHVYVSEFKSAGTGASMSEKDDVERELGVLRAVLADARDGHLLRTTRMLVAAELLTDFMEQARHLIDNGYHVPGASLVGAVLESGLREIAQRNGVTVQSGDDISTLNQKCSNATVYSAIQRKKVEVWAGIRNHADHGKFDAVTKEDVELMQREVEQFLSCFLS